MSVHAARTGDQFEHHGAVPCRPIAIVGAPSSIGIRPYDDRPEARRLDRAPAVLLDLGLAARLRAEHLGTVRPPPYRDFTRPDGGVRNEREVAEYSRALGACVARALQHGRFPLVLGGDCSIVLGSLLGARAGGRVALVYVDAHADFAAPRESRTGSAASMCLALAVGRGGSPLARLDGASPLVHGEDVVLIGRRDDGQSYGQGALSGAGILDLPDVGLSRLGGAAVAARALERLARSALAGFWIHVDADVLNPRVMPAVDSPEPGGPDLDGLAALLSPLVRHPRALGMQVTIYDPALDTDRACGRRLVSLLARVLGHRPTGGDR